MEHFITLEQAIDMTTRFRENREAILQDPYKGADILPIAETFDRAAFDTLLANPACRQVRIYQGMDADRKVHTIIVGVDADGMDLLPGSATPGAASVETTNQDAATEEDTESSNVIIEVGTRCPPDCIKTELNP